MLRITIESEYAFLLLEKIGSEGNLKTANELAAQLGLPNPITSKVLKMLKNGKILNSTRGAQGGYYLAKEAKDISLLEVISALDGNVGLVRCARKTKSGKCCSFFADCPIKKFWLNLDSDFKKILANKTLADMVVG